MPRDFKTFAEQNKKVIDENKDKAQDFNELINKYKNMDNNALMQNLFAEASRLKSEGKLDAATLTNLKNTISPFLNNEQQNMLNQLINAINQTWKI